MLLVKQCVIVKLQTKLLTTFLNVFDRTWNSGFYLFFNVVLNSKLGGHFLDKINPIKRFI